jgi:hypothetical protein
MSVSSAVDWLSDLDWGSVPAWVGAVSFLLAFRVFVRNRTTAQRQQVDLLGLWMRPAWERRMPEDELIQEVTFARFVRNGSELPIDVVQIAYDVETRWMVPDPDQWSTTLPVYQAAQGTGLMRFYVGPLRVIPGETWTDEAEPQKINITHLAPEHAAAVDILEGVNYKIRWALVSDNRGQRWVVTPGHQTRRVRWYSLGRNGYPRDWFPRYQWAARRFPHWVHERWARRSPRRRLTS